LSQPLRKEFEALRNRWQGQCQDGHLPCRSAFPPESLVPWIGHIQLVEVVREDETTRFRARLVGTRIVYYQGQDNTGLFLDEVIPADERDAILAPYRDCMDRRQPVYSVFYSCGAAAISSQLERMILPLASDGDHVDQFLVAIYRVQEQA
jgi:hypothetical protein